MPVIDLDQFRQEQEYIVQEALDDPLADIHSINSDLEDEAELMELARLMVYPPLYSVKGRNYG